MGMREKMCRSCSMSGGWWLGLKEGRERGWFARGLSCLAEEGTGRGAGDPPAQADLQAGLRQQMITG